MISKSVLASPGGSIAAPTSCTRRSAFVNVPSFSRKRAGRQDHVRVLGRLGLEDVLADEELEVLERGDDVGGVRVGLGDVLAEDVHRLQVARDRGVEHLRDRVALLARDLDAPRLLELPRGGLVADRAIRRVGVRQRAHVARALHVVLAAQRQQRRAEPADVARHQRHVADQLDDLGAVLVLGHARGPTRSRRSRPRRRCGRPATRSSAGMPVISSTTSGVYCGSSSSSAS